MLLEVNGSASKTEVSVSHNNLSVTSASFQYNKESNM